MSRRPFAGAVFRATIFAVPTVIAFNNVVGSPTRVGGLSMQPALNPHLKKSAGAQSGGVPEVVWEDRYSIRLNNYTRGSIVIFRNPFNPKERLIKRLIAVGGDWVHPRGNLYSAVRVPMGHCWVEGDNGSVSDDSNDFGPIALALIEGKATYVLWPSPRKLVEELPRKHRGLQRGL